MQPYDYVTIKILGIMHTIGDILTKMASGSLSLHLRKLKIFPVDWLQLRLDLAGDLLILKEI